MIRNQEAAIWTETYCAASLQLVAGDSGYRFDCLDDLFRGSYVALLKHGHRFRIDGLNECGLLVARYCVRGSCLQRAELVSSSGLNNSDRFSPRPDRCNQTAIAIEANHANRSQQLATSF